MKYDPNLFKPKKKTNKYKAEKVKTKQGTFDSKGEWKRWKYLVGLEKNDVIQNLQRQVSYSLDVNGHHICRYVADAVFDYKGVTYVEDFKGVLTNTFRLKRKLMMAVHGIDVKIIRKQETHPKNMG